MITSTQRILTTHVGSLPRTRAVTDVVFGKEQGTLTDAATHDRVIAEAVRDVVARQVQAGVDIVERRGTEQDQLRHLHQGPHQRLCGRQPQPDAAGSRGISGYLAQARGRRDARVPASALRRADWLRRLAAPRGRPVTSAGDALAGQPVHDAFMNAAVARGHRALPAQPLLPVRRSVPRGHRRGHAARVRGDRRRAGFVLQIDSPDLGLGRHTMYKDRTEAEVPRGCDACTSRRSTTRSRNMPADRVRMHVCWGNYEGPHHSRRRHGESCCRSRSRRGRRRCCSRRATRATRTNGRCSATPDSRGQDPDSRSHRLGDQLRRAPAARRGADRPVR